jgi:hypothetical protein
MREPDALFSEMLSRSLEVLYKINHECYVLECSESEDDRTDVKALVMWSEINKFSADKNKRLAHDVKVMVEDEVLCREQNCSDWKWKS